MAFVTRAQSVALMGLGLSWMGSLPIASGAPSAIDSAIYACTYASVPQVSIASITRERADSLRGGWLATTVSRGGTLKVGRP